MALLHQAIRSHQRFNSKLVRLKDYQIKTEFMPVLLFQFQTGAIKSWQSQPGTPSYEGFQFQTGAIKSANAPRGVGGWVSFQFQTGAIKSKICSQVLADFITVSIPNWCD